MFRPLGPCSEIVDKPTESDTCHTPYRHTSGTVRVFENLIAPQRANTIGEDPTNDSTKTNEDIGSTEKDNSMGPQSKPKLRPPSYRSEHSGLRSTDSSDVPARLFVWPGSRTHSLSTTCRYDSASGRRTPIGIGRFHTPGVGPRSRRLWHSA